MINVHSYESMGTYDGPGLRLVVFLQGCPFRCLYCANPDTIDRVGEATPTTAEHILRMAIDQKPFFGRRGGITFSGGEPSLQAEALIPLFRQLRDNDIHICLDTNGALVSPAIDQLHDLSDLILLDVKQINPLKHRSLTGMENANTLLTARRLAERNRPVWLRYVLVPGITDNRNDLAAWADTFAPMQNVQRVEILPYHTLGVHKYAAMNLPYHLSDTPKNTPRQLETAKDIFANRFACPVIVN